MFPIRVALFAACNMPSRIIDNSLFIGAYCSEFEEQEKWHNHQREVFISNFRLQGPHIEISESSCMKFDLPSYIYFLKQSPVIVEEVSSTTPRAEN